VPDALPLPADLIQLQRARIAADTTLGEYIATVETRRREQYPDPEQLVARRTWSDEEVAELTRLRAARDAAAETVRHHPTIQQAYAEQCWPVTWDALQVAARATD
jgi:hypothetical protein